MPVALPKSKPALFVYDVLAIIAEDLPWATLVHFLKFPDPAPDVVRPELKRRIHQHVARFLPVSLLQNFLDTLFGTGAVIHGSLVREILLVGKEGTGAMKVLAQNLNVLVERYREDELRTLLESNDFAPGSVPVRKIFKDVVYLVEDYVHLMDEKRVCAKLHLGTARSGLKIVYRLFE
jgi:hypothetical protein